jgi:alkanesulfonate monooxygenase SsuD/methylene tetrahydromethanopterin reductase-like flavin-dependent oxidoreductase (luciferase family)
MRVYHFSECPYPDAWNSSTDSLRVTLPSSVIDPVVASDLLNRYLDEWAYCDELGLDIMINEHHSSATCMTTCCSLPLAILARETSRSRILVLGIPIANRTDPVRIAEEMSYIDMVSRGRVEMGFIKAAPYEISPANSNPVRLMERFWEANDLILKAMSTRDGPFNWEGEYFHYRQVNVWPRPYQDPHPPVWVSGGSPSTGVEVAKRGHRITTVLSATGAKAMFRAYREQTARMGRPAPNVDRFAYLALIGVGNTEAEGVKRLRQIKEYLETTQIVGEPFSNPPGFVSPEMNAEGLKRGLKKALGANFYVVTRDGRRLDQATCSIEDLISAGTCFAGTPDQVFNQIKEFHEYVGGVGHMIGMFQGGHLNHEETMKNLALFSKDVLPRLRVLPDPDGAQNEADELVRKAAKAG